MWGGVGEKNVPGLPTVAHKPRVVLQSWLKQTHAASEDP